MEPARTAVEDALFTNIYSPVYTVGNKPAGFDSDGANTQVSVLNASSSINKKMGPGLVLKVMKGDQVQLNTYAFYNTATQAPDAGVNILPDLLNTLTGSVIGSSGGKVLLGQSSALASVLSPNMADFLNNDRSYDNTRPKAYLNWVLFDNQFNFVAGSSGVVQVLAGSSKQALVAPLQTIAKNGYLYVYVSNESPQNVYFDDVTVTHYTGPLLEEQAYYPYGLQMQGLSDRAVLKTGNPYKYNASSELEDEDGLEYYNTFYRKYDAQIGRFTGVDILAEATYGFTPFQFGANNPSMFNDPTGALFAGAAGRAQKGPDGNYHTPWMSNLMWNDKGFYSPEDLGYEYSGGGGSYFHFTGISSQSVLDQMPFGGSFSINKNGEFGYWVGNPFDPTQKGYVEQGGHHEFSPEVAVGTNKTWLPFSVSGDPSFLSSPTGLSCLSFNFSGGPGNWQEAGLKDFRLRVKLFDAKTGYYTSRKIILSQVLYYGLPKKYGNGKILTPGEAAIKSANATTMAGHLTMQEVATRMEYTSDQDVINVFRRNLDLQMRIIGGTISVKPNIPNCIVSTPQYYLWSSDDCN